MLPPLATEDDLNAFCTAIIRALTTAPSPLSTPSHTAAFHLAGRRWGVFTTPNPFFTSQAFFDAWEAIVEKNNPGRSAGLDVNEQAKPSAEELDWLSHMQAEYPPTCHESPSIRSVATWAKLMSICTTDDLDFDIQVSENHFLRVTLWRKRQRQLPPPLIGLPIVPPGPKTPWTCTNPIFLQVSATPPQALAA